MNSAKAGQVLLSLVVSPFLGFFVAWLAFLAAKRILRRPSESRPLVSSHRPWWRQRWGRPRSEERNLLRSRRLRASLPNRDEPASFLHGEGSGRATRPLTLRITPVPTDDPGILRLEGRLRAEEVPVLERCAADGIRALDLTDLTSADEEGLAALRRLRDRGIEVRNASHYLAMLLA